MSIKQKQVLLVLTMIGIFYFLVFIPPNSSSRLGGSAFSIFSNDEYITYPYVEKMLSPGDNIHETWANLIIYEDYHYGYPFYFLSMLVLLPVRLILGEAFFQNQPLNILILRQFINVLPGIIAVVILVFVKTKFKNWMQSIVLFVFLLSIPSLGRSNIWWWHPDAFTFLFVTLTILFLDLDNFRLGKKFYLVAIFCGLAAATKLIGFFFVLTIPLYLFIALKRKLHSIKKILMSAILFVLVMFSIILVSNPFLFYEAPRNEMIAIQKFKQIELKEGYTHGDPYTYQKGPVFWEWTIRTWFAPSAFILFIVISSAVSIIINSRETSNVLIASWSYPFMLYTLFFVAPKPNHYIFPSLFPLFLFILDIPLIISQHWNKLTRTMKVVAITLILVIVILIIFQFSTNFIKISDLRQDFLIQNL